MRKHQSHRVVIDKLVHGGQGLGALEDGRKALVWNVLPGEEVDFTVQRKKASYLEGIAQEIVKESKERQKPLDDLYLSTSPWQMMTYKAENKYKKEILIETLKRAGVVYSESIEFYAPSQQLHYRNKMEYSFYGDDDGLHLALFNRGTHHKQITNGSSIARPEIDDIANKIYSTLNQAGVRASDLKSLVIRCNQKGECVAALFTKDQKFSFLKELEAICKGIVIYFSNPKSPASVITKQLYLTGDIILEDNLLNQPISYDVMSFFQVNIEPYETVLKTIKKEVEKAKKITDMYAGVGSIGLSVSDQPTLVEVDENSAAMASFNIQKSKNKNAEVVKAAAEKATQYISADSDNVVIFDPPRAGLHKKVIETILDTLPAKIIYLSCNPSTLARDLAFLQDSYNIKSISGHNFFPRTPHIEALTILDKK